MKTQSIIRNTLGLAGLVLALFSLVLAVSPTADARSDQYATTSTGCPDGWVPAPAPGGCLPDNYITEDLDPIKVIFECPPRSVMSNLGCVPSWLTTENFDPIEAIFECPDRFELSRFGCVPTWFTTDQPRVVVFNCPDGWVPAAAGLGACQPGTYADPGSTGTFDFGCPDKWVPAPVPGGCQPGFVKARTDRGEALIGVALCPEGWVPASVPGGCQPGRIKIETADQGILAAQHHCAFGNDICAPMVDAIKALGGDCVEGPFGQTCTLPDFPEDED